MRTNLGRRGSRAAFTLVEVLVASALTILIMVILTGAFQAGLDTFRQLKTAGDLQEQLRTCAVVLKNDLVAQHFDDVTTATAGPRLSDQMMLDPAWAPPTKGFFRVVCPTAGVTTEGNDAYGIPSSLAGNHILHFTVKRGGTSLSDVFSAPTIDLASGAAVGFTDRIGDPQILPPPPHVNTINELRHPDYTGAPPGARYFSQWAEIAYFLRPQAAPDNVTSDGTTGRYRLYRRQRLLIPEGHSVTIPGAYSAANLLNYQDMSISDSGTAAVFNTEVTIVEPQRRMGASKLTPPVGTINPLGYVDPIEYPILLGPREGDDVLLTDVVSFEVKLMWFSATTPANVPANAPLPTGAEAPFSALGATNNTDFNAPPLDRGVFDTWCGTDTSTASATRPVAGRNFTTWASTGTDVSLPLRMRVRAVQVRVRIWDPKTETTRQITTVQDL